MAAGRHGGTVTLLPTASSPTIIYPTTPPLLISDSGSRALNKGQDRGGRTPIRWPAVVRDREI